MSGLFWHPGGLSNFEAAKGLHAFEQTIFSTSKFEKHMRLLAAILTLLIVSAFAPQANKTEPADLVLKNGNVYTVNEKQPHAEAIAVKGSRIVFVGTNADAEKCVGSQTRVIDLHGQTVVPGLTDAHYHFIGVGQREMSLNLEGTTSLEDFLAKVKARLDQAKPGEWITGRGWIETFWTPPIFPTRWDLDKVAPNNPVFLGRADGHGAVANSAALKIGKVTRDTPDPFGGQILKDKQSGEPTGMLLDNAQSFITSHLPRAGEGDTEKAMILANNRSVESARHGSLDACLARLREIAQALALVNAQDGLAAEIKKRGEKMSAGATWRNANETVPQPASLPPAGTGGNPDANVLVDDYWDVYKVLLR